MQDWKKIFVGYLSLLVLGFLDNVRGPYYPDIISDLNLSDTLGSLFFIIVSTMTIFSGQLTPDIMKRVGLSNVIRMGHGLMLFGCLGIGLSQSFLTLSIACVVFGIGFGFINVGQNFMIIEGAKPHRRRQLLSGLHSVYALASLMAPACVSFMKLSGFEWRKGFIVLVSLPFVAFCFSFLVPTQKSALPQAVQKKEKSFAKGLSHWKTYFSFATQISLYIAAELCLTTRFVLLLRREYEMSDVLAPQFLSAFFALLLLGRLIFTFFPFAKWSSHRIISIALALSFVAFTLGLVHSPYWLVLCGLTMAPVFGVSLDYLADLFPKDSESAIASTLAISAIFIISMHFIVGVLTEHYGIGKALFIGPLLLLGSLIYLQFLPRESLSPKS